MSATSSFYKFEDLTIGDLEGMTQEEMLAAIEKSKQRLSFEEKVRKIAEQAAAKLCQ